MQRVSKAEVLIHYHVVNCSTASINALIDAVLQLTTWYWTMTSTGPWRDKLFVMNVIFRLLRCCRMWNLNQCLWWWLGSCYPPPTTTTTTTTTPFLNEVERGVYWFHLVRLSICGQNRVRSVSSTILIGSISYLHTLSSNFRKYVACNVCFKFKNLKFWQIP